VHRPQPTFGNTGFSGRREGLSSAAMGMHRPQPHIRKIREDFLSGREGLSHGTDSVRLGCGKGHSASFGIPNFRIFLKTYLNGSKHVKITSGACNLTIQAWNALKFLTISSRPQTLWGHAKCGADLRSIFASRPGSKMLRRFPNHVFRKHQSWGCRMHHHS
jgi:hypothetical protein